MCARQVACGFRKWVGDASCVSDASLCVREHCRCFGKCMRQTLTAVPGSSSLLSIFCCVTPVGAAAAPVAAGCPQTRQWVNDGLRCCWQSFRSSSLCARGVMLSASVTVTVTAHQPRAAPHSRNWFGGDAAPSIPTTQKIAAPNLLVPPRHVPVLLPSALCAPAAPLPHVTCHVHRLRLKRYNPLHPVWQMTGGPGMSQRHALPRALVQVYAWVSDRNCLQLDVKVKKHIVRRGLRPACPTKVRKGRRSSALAPSLLFQPG